MEPLAEMGVLPKGDTSFKWSEILALFVSLGYRQARYVVGRSGWAWEQGKGGSRSDPDSANSFSQLERGHFSAFFTTGDMTVSW
jgi:hypothetical protein